MDADDMRDIALQAFGPAGGQGLPPAGGGMPLAQPPVASPGPVPASEPSLVSALVSSPCPSLFSSPCLSSWQRYIPLMVEYVRRLQEDVVDLRLYGTTVDATLALALAH